MRKIERPESKIVEAGGELSQKKRNLRVARGLRPVREQGSMWEREPLKWRKK